MLPDSALQESLLTQVGGPRLVDWHRHKGTSINADDYLALYRRLLDHGISQCLRIYLDTNYWIGLRDAEMGRGSDEKRELLRQIREVVRARQAICVGHVSTISELSKQEGESLKATARLYDELTEGLVIAAPPELRFFELLQFMTSKSGQPAPSTAPCWTKVGQAMKSGLPNFMPEPCSESDRRVVRKCALDALWNMRLEDMFEQFGWEPTDKLDTAPDAGAIQQVEELKLSRKTKRRSRKKARVEEFSTLLHSTHLDEFIEHLLLLARGRPLDRHAATQSVTQAISFAIDDFRCDRLGALLPNAVISTELYVLHESASMERKLTAKDWQDWQHAAVALPYCDYFFTERHLANQLTSVLRLDTRYRCRVGSSVSYALEELRTLVQSK